MLRGLTSLLSNGALSLVSVKKMVGWREKERGFCYFHAHKETMNHLCSCWACFIQWAWLSASDLHKTDLPVGSLKYLINKQKPAELWVLQQPPQHGGAIMMLIKCLPLWQQDRHLCCKQWAVILKVSNTERADRAEISASPKSDF